MMLTVIPVTTFWILVLLCRGILPGVEEHQTSPAELQVSGSGTFKISIFSDLHYGEEESGWGIDQDVNSTRVMRSVLASEQGVDLVVINGDLITGENTFRANASAYVHAVVAPMVAARVPWASTYGNHDSAANLSREHMLAAEQTYGPLALTRQMNVTLPGVSNYYVLLRLAGRPVAVLWFFDSRGGTSYAADRPIPEWVAPETAAWFRAQSARLRADHGPLHALAFVHIPPHVFLGAQTALLDPHLFPGVNDDVPAAIQGDDSQHQDAPFVDALLADEGLHSVYVGHDHGNAWCSLWPADARRTRPAAPAPFLCFGKHTGYGGYGNWRRGARIVQLSFVDTDGDGDYDDWDEMRVETWVRLEGQPGDVVTHVHLNATYGLDIYPTENGEPGS
jgi:hypothetical protein